MLSEQRTTNNERQFVQQLSNVRFVLCSFTMLFQLILLLLFRLSLWNVFIRFIILKPSRFCFSHVKIFFFFFVFTFINIRESMKMRTKSKRLSICWFKSADSCNIEWLCTNENVSIYYSIQKQIGRYIHPIPLFWLCFVFKA